MDVENKKISEEIYYSSVFLWTSWVLEQFSLKKKKNHT